MNNNKIAIIFLYFVGLKRIDLISELQKQVQDMSTAHPTSNGFEAGVENCSSCYLPFSQALPPIRLQCLHVICQSCQPTWVKCPVCDKIKKIKKLNDIQSQMAGQKDNCYNFSVRIGERASKVYLLANIPETAQFQLLTQKCEPFKEYVSKIANVNIMMDGKSYLYSTIKSCTLKQLNIKKKAKGQMTMIYMANRDLGGKDNL